MKFTSISVIASLAALTSAQQLPACAQTCAATGLANSGCKQIDVGCICASSNFISAVTCCVTGACSPADQEATIQYAQSICGPEGVTVPTSAVCASGASSTAAAAASSAAASSAAASSAAASSNPATTAGTTQAGGASSTGSSSPTGSSSGGSAVSSTPAATVASGTSSVTPTSSVAPGAAARVGGLSFGAAGAAVAAFALL